MEAKTLAEKSEKISTLIGVAKEANNLFFEKKEEKLELVKLAIDKLKAELNDY